MTICAQCGAASPSLLCADASRLVCPACFDKPPSVCTTRIMSKVSGTTRVSE
jgi:hypothetical protein